MRIKNEFQILEEIVLTVDKIGIEKTVEIIIQNHLDIYKELIGNIV